ncbi:MAG: iron chelate uptake ABC transporter family permease subunit [Micropruina sp.]|uniref:FecCD family ABC transporter permease n=1 Tax=Micropruina sp. TaxID=2737536 RepID=UPI0039E65846
MSSTNVATRAATAPAVAARAGLAFAVATGLLVLGMLVSLGVGSNPIPLDRVWQLLWHPDGSFDAVVVLDQRLPRTLVLVVVGAALGVAGALMQSLTRNPLADPGILGINAGASLAVVLVVALTGLSGIGFYLWFAFAGAAAAAVGVYLLGMAGSSSPSPVRLALAGVAISMTVASLVQTVILANANAFNEFRFWAAGSVEGRGYPVLVATGGFILAGLLLACCLAPALNALALGEDAGRALGVRVGLVRGLAVLAVTVLAGAATAAAGPIMFVGLGVPYLARAVFGPDQRLVLPGTALAAPVLLLAADVVARLVVLPGEVPVGVVAAILGGPAFVLIVRRPRIEAL